MSPTALSPSDNHGDGRKPVSYMSTSSTYSWLHFGFCYCPIRTINRNVLQQAYLCEWQNPSYIYLFAVFFCQIHILIWVHVKGQFNQNYKTYCKHVLLMGPCPVLK